MLNDNFGLLPRLFLAGEKLGDKYKGKGYFCQKEKQP